MKSQTSNICYCLICNKPVKERGLPNHIINSHKILPKEYYDKYLKKPDEGICPVTGKPTRFKNIREGYCKYVRGANTKTQEHKEKTKQTCFKKYGVEYPLQNPQVRQKVKKTCLEKYGIECSLQAEEVKEKARQTCLEKYGVEYIPQAEEVKEKARQTCLEKYGVDHPSQIEEVKQKKKETCLKHYGVENPSQVEEIKQKKKETYLRNFGVEHPSQIEEVKQKKKETYLKHYGVESPLQNSQIKEKIKRTCLEKYGVENPSQSPVIRAKIQQTCLKHYGVENPSQIEEVRQKARETCLKKYGVEYVTQLPEIRRQMSEKYKVVFSKKLCKYLQELDFELVDSQYQHAHYKHRWKCLKCGTEFKQPWYSIQQGYLCPKCYPRPCGSSKQEEEIADFVKSLGVEVIRHDRTLINPLELDIVIPDKKIAIEYNGLYWHNEEHVGKNYHLQKTKLCKEKGYRLIHIFEDEWILKKDIVKSRLKHILGKTEDCTHIGARQCTIKEISSKEKNNVLEQYHIQGSDVSKVKLGAFYKNQLVAVMTFSHGSLAKGVKHQNSLVWELNRFCTHSKFVISGIASKLLEHFKKNYEWKEIFSYADRRWSDGDLYKKLGFQLEHITRPNYWYVGDFERIHRFNLRKRSGEPKDIPEYILRLQEGYIRVWDCGNLKFSLTY